MTFLTEEPADWLEHVVAWRGGVGVGEAVLVEVREVLGGGVGVVGGGQQPPLEQPQRVRPGLVRPVHEAPVHVGAHFIQLEG